MNWETGVAIIAIVITAGAALGLITREALNRPHGRSPTPPSIPLPSGPRPTRRDGPPILRSYEGAARLQRATAAAEAWMDGRDNALPGGPLDLGDMTRAIVAAWVGEEEEMVRIPVMKLSDIKPEPSAEPPRQSLTGDAALARINADRAKMDLPPLKTLGWPRHIGGIGDDA